MAGRTAKVIVVVLLTNTKGVIVLVMVTVIA
jgi:hypothetical protein